MNSLNSHKLCTSASGRVGGWVGGFPISTSLILYNYGTFAIGFEAANAG